MRAVLLLFGRVVAGSGEPSGNAVTDDENWFEQLEDLTLPAPLRILLILAVAIALTMILGGIMRRAVRRTLTLVTRQLDIDRARSQARERAIASALRSGIIGVIWAAAVITIVGELGVNIGGVLATATVIGGAVAFGAQTLVRDVIAGFFVLVEDQYGVGDDVDVGLARGAVQKITLRTVRLRDAEGRVWHVPHGNVQRVANLSAASLAVIDLEIDRTMPLERVDALAEELRAALEDDESTADLLLGSSQVIGISGIHDDRVIYRLVAPTKPGRQAEVQRRWTTLAVEVFHRAIAPGEPDAITQLRAVRSPGDLSADN
jgi:small conductance mechanosensitive channel